MNKPSSKSRDARDQILSELRRELMGPSEPEELIVGEFPTTRYIAGRLAPAKSGEDDLDAVVDPAENDSMGAGSDDQEAGADEHSPPLVIGFNPSSMGVSFLVDGTVKRLDIEVSWGDYKWEKIDGEGVWKRYPRIGKVTGVSIETQGKIPAIPLSPQHAPAGVTIAGIDDVEIFIEGVVHAFAGYRAVSLFLVNRRTKGALSDRTKHSRKINFPFSGRTQRVVPSR